MAAEEVVAETSLLKGVFRTVYTAASVLMAGIGMGAASNVSASLLISFGTGSGTEQEIAAAPIMSDTFEKQFDLYVISIKSGIKQVTLGGYRE